MNFPPSSPPDSPSSPLSPSPSSVPAQPPGAAALAISPLRQHYPMALHRSTLGQLPIQRSDLPRIPFRLASAIFISNFTSSSTPSADPYPDSSFHTLASPSPYPSPTTDPANSPPATPALHRHLHIRACRHARPWPPSDDRGASVATSAILLRPTDPAA